MIEAKCKCGKAYSVKDELAGKTVRCKACGGTLVIPQAQPDEPEVVEEEEQEPEVVENQGTQERFNALDLGGKVILGSTGVGLLSLFLPWVSLGFLSVNGFQQQGFFLLIPHAVLSVLLWVEKFRSKVGAYVGAGIAFAIAIGYYMDKNVDIGYGKFNPLTTGFYLCAASIIGLAVGVYLHQFPGSEGHKPRKITRHGRPAARTGTRPRR